MGPLTFDISTARNKRVLSIPSIEAHNVLARTSTRDFAAPQEFLEHIDIGPELVVSADQVHADGICIVSEKDAGGAQKRSCDALITNSPNVALIIRTADCIPLFILEPAKRIIGLVHIGWRGAVKWIAAKVIGKMCSNFAISASECIIAVGPSIKKDCYEVDKAVVLPLEREFRDHWKYLTKRDDDHWLFDLEKLCIDQMVEAGAKESNIRRSIHCTHCEGDLFFSYRREGERAKRLFSVMLMRE